MKTLNVLVVDDEPGIRSGILRILKKFSVSYPFMDEDVNFKIFDVGTGEDGIDIVQNKKIDIILLDNKLPGMQGMDVLKHINQNNPEILVMMITSYASLELAVKATEQGAHDFIPKPFTPQELKSSMEGVVKHLYLKGMTNKMNQEGKEIRYQFLSVLSHELKAPLNAIDGYLRIMEEKQVGENIGDYEQIINRSQKRIKGMRSLIMDLLDLTKIQFEKKTDKFETVNVKEIAVMAIEVIDPYAIQKDVSIKIVDRDKDIVINADPRDIEIILNNLVSNAVKYNKNNGSVKLAIEETDSDIKIIVADTGIGMTEESKEKLFDEFYRIKNDNTKNISGSGLGLSIIKKIVDLYNGKIEVKSQINEGSTFCITLPK
ncbi:MAG: ATP-binding protein [Bacteroidales bacterium]|jgi:two-component system sensor histidine kinase/response regulator|nr:ATP-binding protein [Bacteroidales bacterium]